VEVTVRHTHSIAGDAASSHVAVRIRTMGIAPAALSVLPLVGLPAAQASVCAKPQMPIGGASPPPHQPHGIVADPAANVMWFTRLKDNKIGKLTLSGTPAFNNFAITPSGAGTDPEPNRITVGPGGTSGKLGCTFP